MIARHGYPWQQSRTSGTATAPAVRAPEIVSPVPRVTLSPREAAAALGISTGTLETLRRAGQGPPSLVLPGGRRRLYPVAGLVEWAAARAASEQATAGEDGDGERDSGDT
jgi:hypothetical protein